MKRLKVILLSAGFVISAGAWAGIPADCDCDAWLALLNRCENSASGRVYGMTCSEIYSHWRDCQSGASC